MVDLIDLAAQIGSSIDVPHKHLSVTDLMLHQRCRICRRCAAVDVYRNDDRATRAFPIARDCDIDPRASAKGHVGPRPRPDERRLVSDNKIQLKFRTKDFAGEYFHY